EPARPIGERRIKRSPVVDVAGMLRSFHYAAFANLFDLGSGVPIREGDLPRAEMWSRFWYTWVSVAFLKSYLEHARDGGFLPADDEDLQILLDAFVLDKAVY